MNSKSNVTGRDLLPVFRKALSVIFLAFPVFVATSVSHVFSLWGWDGIHAYMASPSILPPLQVDASTECRDQRRVAAIVAFYLRSRSYGLSQVFFTEKHLASGTASEARDRLTRQLSQLAHPSR